MAATKRKRRGGLAVQAKKLKRDAKDGKLPTKPNDVSEEAAEEEKDRIPGPVCKVKGALRPRLHALSLWYLPDYRSAGFRDAWGITGAPSQLSLRDQLPPLHLTLVHVAALLAGC